MIENKDPNIDLSIDPTQEESIPIQEESIQGNTNQEEPSKSNKKRNIIIATVIAIIILLLLLTKCSVPKGNVDAKNANYETVPPIHLIIDSKDFKSTSSPVIAHIKGQTTNEEEVDFYHAIHANPQKDSNKTVDELLLNPGHYAFEFTPSISDNGSLLEVTATDLAVESVFIENKDDKVNPIEVILETNLVPAEEISSERMHEVADNSIKAVESKNIDNSLVGDKAKDTLDKISNNISKNDKIDADVADKVDKKVEDVDVADKATISKPDTKPVESPKKDSPSSKPKDNPKKKVWVVDKKAYDEQVKVKDAYSDKVCVSKAYDEQVKVKDGWNEQVKVKDAWSEKVKVKDAVYETTWSSRFICTDGHICYSQEELGDYLDWHDVGYSNDPIEHKTLVSDAKYETVHHDAQYKTVYHDPQYKTVHHDAKYKTVNYPAQYKTVHHNEQGHWEWK